MKVVVAAHGFPPKQIAGAEWQAHRTAKFLSDQGHDVSVVAVDEIDASLPEMLRVVDEQVDGISVTRLSYNLAQRWGDATEYDNPIVFDYFQKRFEQERPDVLHIYSGYQLTSSVIRVAKQYGVKVLINLTDFWFLCPRITLTKSTGEVCQVPDDPLACALCLHSEQRRLRIPHRLSRGKSSDLILSTMQRGWLPKGGLVRTRDYIEARRARLLQDLRQADCIMSNSRFLGGLFMQHGIDPRKIAYVRQGMNRDRWVVAAPAETTREAVHIGYIGQIAAHKGVKELVEAFRQLPFSAETAKLYIYGDIDSAWPAFREQLLRTIGNDPRIILAGRFANPNLPKVHANLDALVVPSLWYENSPNVILESFSLGTPVIASNLGGMAELVQHDINGRLFAAGDVAALSDELNAIISYPAMLSRYVQNMPPIPTIDAEMTQLLDLYADLITYEQPLPI